MASRHIEMVGCFKRFIKFLLYVSYPKCYNYDTTTTRLAVSVWGLMFVFYFILILSILIVSIKYNVER